ncbi:MULTISPECIES: hypothetical protein [Nocardia]|uniref:hypothetical protein n=1 Tax=Nocardia TaxID=1817 RepID=UPI0005BDE93E|nr:MULTISPECIES: hypothetical protein [Nocardia]MBF6237210.1 hypothetical protein [Nocardia otitidiscaviarum]MBF6487061.1 hypothetical protein [Nocardia otitidiscaviarum]
MATDPYAGLPAEFVRAMRESEEAEASPAPQASTTASAEPPTTEPTETTMSYEDWEAERMRGSIIDPPWW